MKPCSRCREQPARGAKQAYCRDCHADAERRRPKRKRPSPKYADLTPAGKLRETARVSAYVAVKQGKLIPQPCVCGCDTPIAQLEKHHEDYTKPREVVWTCKPYHRLLDARRRARLRSAHGEETPRVCARADEGQGDRVEA